MEPYITYTYFFIYLFISALSYTFAIYIQKHFTAPHRLLL